MNRKSELPLALRAAYIALHRRTDAALAELNTTADQFVLLATLHRGDALTQRELARRMPSDPSTVRAMLVLLEKQGLVKRKTHPADSRALTVSLTARGKKKFEKLWTAGEELRSQMLSVIPSHQVDAFIENLNALAESLSRDFISQSQSVANPSN